MPFVILLALTALTLSAVQAAPSPPLVERYLIEGKLAEGEAALTDALRAEPKDGQARFGLGTVQFLRAVERLIQSFHRYGLRSGLLGTSLPFERLPIPPNDKSEPIRYANLRAVMQTWNDDLARAEATLAQVEDQDVKLPLHFGKIRLDFDGDGKADPEEVLWQIYARLNAQARNQVSAQDAEQFVITFDRGDVAWLRGYCHLLMTFGEVYLAHDGQELFDHTAPMFFPKAETPFAFLGRGANGIVPGPDHQPPPPRDPVGLDDILDAVAMIHLLRLPVSDPARMKKALDHLEAMIALSRESWKFIIAETDDDREWVPSPKQHSVMPGGAVTMDMVKGWLEFLDEAKAILKGEKLIPFWRADGRGINLRRVFTEPRTFDLVLWVQGTAAAPYLERGKKTDLETWRRFQRIFQGEFIGFAIWFN
jgi:hypothetical protein